MRQPERQRALAQFRAGKTTTLVATDVAARGLHIKRLPHIINYDFPPSLEQCVMAWRDDVVSGTSSHPISA